MQASAGVHDNWWVTLKRRTIAIGHLIAGAVALIIVFIFLILGLIVFIPTVGLDWVRLCILVFLCAIPAVWGIDKINNGHSALKPRFTDAAGPARWGVRKDIEPLLASSSEKPHSRGKSLKNIYLGMFGEKTPLHYAGVKHGITTGPPRSGKGSGLFVQNLYHLDDWSIVVVDPKNELASITANHRRKCGDVLVMKPLGVHSESSGFNPMATASFVSNMFKRAVSMAWALIPRSGTREDHWPDGARELMVCLIMYASMEAAKIGRVASLALVNELLRLPFDSDNPKTKTLIKIMREMTEMEDPKYAELRRFASQFSENNKEIRSFVSSARTPLAFLNNDILLADLDKHPIIDGKAFDFQMLKDRVMTVYIVLPDDELKKYAFWLRLVVGNALEALNEGVPGKVRTLLMVDEAGNLENLEALDNAMRMGAEKLMVWTAWQGFFQIQQHYGDHGLKAFLAGAGFCNSFGAAGDDFSADYISRRAGTTVVKTKSYNIDQNSSATTGANETVTEYPLIQRSEVMGLSDRKIVSWIEPVAVPLMLRAPSYLKMKGMRGLDHNPYYEKS